MSDFLIKLAQNKKDIELAQRLRYEVFNLELKKGLSSSHKKGLDEDEYDQICDHVLIIDTKQSKTVGTYRLLLRSRLGRQGRFYSEQEFDLENIKKLDGEILELGRSCVHKDYRSNSILYLLWQRIMAYVEDHRVNFIIGCPSLYTMDVKEISDIYSLMKKKHFASDKFRVYPKENLRLQGLSGGVESDDQTNKIMLRLPSLIRSYIKIGALVCGEPALDTEFSTTDFFMLLEVSRLTDNYLRRFHLHKLPQS